MGFIVWGAAAKEDEYEKYGDGNGVDGAPDTGTSGTTKKEERAADSPCAQDADGVLFFCISSLRDCRESGCVNQRKGSKAG